MEVQVAPLRAWDDFFPGSDRFARPDFKDISKWNNRVVSNLLYYQTNYLMVAAAVVSIVGLHLVRASEALDPASKLVKILCITGSFGLCSVKEESENPAFSS